MGLMAGMLPGVEFARRRRLRDDAGARRPSSLGVFGHDHAHLGSAGFAKKRSGVCEEAWAAQLDGIAREAKERLDHKLRSQRESVVKRRHSTGSLRLPAPSSATSATTPAGSALQREVFTKKSGGRRFSWGRRREQQQQQQAECAVCLEEFRAGDVLAHLPCAHRFHWACAVPWVQAASRCPFCRAAVRLADDHQHHV